MTEHRSRQVYCTRRGSIRRKTFCLGIGCYRTHVLTQCRTGPARLEPSSQAVASSPHPHHHPHTAQQDPANPSKPDPRPSALQLCCSRKHHCTASLAFAAHLQPPKRTRVTRRNEEKEERQEGRGPTSLTRHYTSPGC
nr:hypothetical protein CFP56_28705 [Quercus suber]